jgi:hypothetical protein
MKKAILLCAALVTSNAYAFQLNNGTIIIPGHFIDNPNNGIYIPSEPVHAEMTSLGAQAMVLKVATNFAYHTTTNHSVYIVNDSGAPQTYNWFFQSCPEHYGCTTWAGVVNLNPGGSYCESGTIQPGIKYGTLGIYQNKAVTQTIGYDPQYVYSIAPIQVS